MCGAAGGLTCACLGVPLAVARAALLAAGPTAAFLNRPMAAEPSPTPAFAAPGGGAEGVDEDDCPGLVELRATLLAGGPVVGLPRDALRGLVTLYDESYSHETDAAALRAAAAAAGCTHVVVAAGRAGDVGPLKVAAGGAAEVALGDTAGDETRVSHGTHWYCRRERGFGFAPNDDVERGDVLADGSHKDDPLRLSWIVNSKYGGWRAGDVCDLSYSEWRKLVWGFRL